MMGMTWQEGDPERRGDSGDRRWRTKDRRANGGRFRSLVSADSLVGVLINPDGTMFVTVRDSTDSVWPIAQQMFDASPGGAQQMAKDAVSS